ncbi:MAG: hypothetical protein ACKVP7_08610 [Hyphomicrobiaceae bacterium]
MLFSRDWLAERDAIQSQLDAIRVAVSLLKHHIADRKANFNPAQLRDGLGRWTGGGGELIRVSDNQPSPLKRLHPDTTYDSDLQAKRSLTFWRTQPTGTIVESLKPGSLSPLAAKPDGTIMQGNTRIKVLQERGFDIDKLPRDPHPSSVPQPGSRPRGGGSGGTGGGGGGLPFDPLTRRKPYS